MKRLTRLIVGLFLIVPLLALAGCGDDGGGEATERTCTWDQSNWNECDWK